MPLRRNGLANTRKRRRCQRAPRLPSARQCVPERSVGYRSGNRIPVVLFPGDLPVAWISFHSSVRLRRCTGLTAFGAEVVCDLPVVLGIKGMTWVGDRLLVVDSPISRVVTDDVVTGTAGGWLQHPLLTSADARSPSSRHG
jgi:hypothetical protein